MHLTKTQARRFLLAYQGLWPPDAFRGKPGILDYIRRVGCIQFDPLNIVGHNSELVLQARVGRFRPVMLKELLYDERKLLDGWDKMMAIYAVEDWPYFRRWREAARRSSGKSASMPVPASLEGVTADWLQQALAPKFAGVAVKTITAERLGEGYGLTSRIFRYQWETGEPPRSVVVNLWPTNGPGGTREVSFYRTFGETVSTRIPACFYASLNLSDQRGVMILEDLGPVVQGDCLLKLSLPQATAVAQGLATLHAAWLAHRALEEATWLPAVASWERGRDWFEPRRALFMQRFGERLDAPARALLNGIVEAQAIANDRLAGAAITLLHADLHLDNFVFMNGTEPVFLDWARCAKGPLALDLYDLLFPMIQEADREQVLATYLEEFVARAGEALDHAAMWRQLGGVFLRKFAIATCGVARWQPASPREAAMIDVGLQRALHDLRYWSTRDPSLFAFL